ncbi:MAG: FAD-dependent monooxygenase [Polaromonas sp.]|uniref:FAD-dependent monooxygenase n=1 Tax=Polaromonas sp. TaxID=1869339 RepID=UPI0025F5A159|nr:FAD-dependent monooxygenase [Polaromonas sp.]MBI2728370.1 FAD-dependent monooxygenase [Polaromonas sp.]
MTPHAPTMRQKTQVLIVGAGPAGQGLAIELGHRGIPCLVIEKNPRIGVAPRAKTTNVRTREHFRRWGIADALRDAAPFGVDYPSNIVFTTRMSGHMLARFDNALYCAPGRNPLYAEHAQWIPQYTVERVMRQHLDTVASVNVQLNCELISFTQDDDGVLAIVRDLETGLEREIEAQFIAGCDGGRSLVRSAIGASMEGTFGLSRNYNIVFHAPGLAEAHPHGKAIMYWQINDDVPSLIGPMDSGDRWFFMPTGLAPDVQVTKDTAADLIRRATGIDLPFEVLSIDEWVAHRVVADRYRDRRAFLAGDACHLHPPYGGFGMNMGVSDAVDLGWKLAAVLQGWGGETLLQSYELERRPVHMHVLQEAATNHSKFSNALFEAGLEDDTPAGADARRRVGKRINAEKLSEFYTLGTILGDRYTSSPVVQPVLGAAPAMRDFLNYVPSSAPGGRAPHAWLHDGSSLFDNFGEGFTLLALPSAAPSSLNAASADAKRLGIPLKILQTDNPAMPALYNRRLTLIRPDQHIAWAGDVWPAAEDFDVLMMVTGQGPVAAFKTTQKETLHESGT